jgi:hypothetical protein
MNMLLIVAGWTAIIFAIAMYGTKRGFWVLYLTPWIVAMFVAGFTLMTMWLR